MRKRRQRAYYWGSEEELVLCIFAGTGVAMAIIALAAMIISNLK